MATAYAIDVQFQTAGVAVGQPGDFKFFSSSPAFDPIDGRIFSSLAHVNRAARDLAVTRRVRGFGASRF